ncbi:amino-acid oxidase [Fusarium denticulatum]|uniref:Amino-acid oxidase n=1 Tax=Fusarium denticulatum TaxID=48507 RepID=A0A8H5X075_9HYPO|nr:amino-acid oxidase [Fusarium denticulatum]
MEAIVNLLKQPNNSESSIASVMNPEAQKMFEEDLTGFERKAREWAVEFARAPDDEAKYAGYNRDLIQRYVDMGFGTDAVVEAFKYVNIDRNHGQDYTLEEAYQGDVLVRLIWSFRLWFVMGAKEAIRALAYGASAKVGMKFRTAWWQTKPFYISKVGIDRDRLAPACALESVIRAAYVMFLCLQNGSEKFKAYDIVLKLLRTGPDNDKNVSQPLKKDGDMLTGLPFHPLPEEVPTRQFCTTKNQDLTASPEKEAN